METWRFFIYRQGKAVNPAEKRNRNADRNGVKKEQPL